MILAVMVISLFPYTASAILPAPRQTFDKNVNDTVFVEYSGIIIDRLTKKPIVFASIILSGTNIGTVSNTEGEFVFKVPPFYENKELEISSIGYRMLKVPIKSLSKTENEISLEPIAYPLDEVEVRKIDPVSLIREVLRNIPKNYGNQPGMLTAFYRETIKQNRNYVAVSEAVFDVYKSGYGKAFDNDRVRIHKGRKSQDVTRMDTVLFKLQGGPYYIFQLDIAKHPGDILSGDILDYYNFKMLGTVNIQERNSYIIEFDQKPNVDLPLYKGFIYIDVLSKAISAVEFSLSDKGISRAAEFMIVKKPANMRVDVPETSYRVNYRYTNGKWVLNYARAEAHFRCRWARRLFRSNYYTMSEMAVTDVEYDNVIKHKIRESSRPGDILVEKISDFEDPEFWGDYNIIQPEQTIEQAIEKLSRRLRRISD